MKKIDWHAGFVSAMKLELIENEKDLIFDEEHPIANRAQRIDLLIIKNENSAVIRNPIGTLFRKFNICEYKSPEQSLTYGDFYKILAYTGLYLNETQSGSKHNSDEYTMTFVREPHPHNLFNRLDADGIDIIKTAPGIYRLSNNLPFPTQVIVSREIPDESKSWLKCLTKHGTWRDLDTIVTKTPQLDSHNKRLADNIMNIFTASNMELVKKAKEEPNMCQAVNELFADEINEMKLIIADKDSLIADKDSQIAKQSALIAQLQAELEKYAKKKA